MSPDTRLEYLRGKLKNLEAEKAQVEKLLSRFDTPLNLVLLEPEIITTQTKTFWQKLWEWLVWWGWKKWQV